VHFFLYLVGCEIKVAWWISVESGDEDNVETKEII
jgi:hypothetical protein